MQTDTSQADAGGEGSDDDYEKARLGGGVPTSQSSAGWGAAGKLGALGLEGQTWCKLLVPSTGWQPAGRRGPPPPVLGNDPDPDP